MDLQLRPSVNNRKVSIPGQSLLVIRYVIFMLFLRTSSRPQGESHDIFSAWRFSSTNIIAIKKYSNKITLFKFDLYVPPAIKH